MSDIQVKLMATLCKLLSDGSWRLDISVSRGEGDSTLVIVYWVDGVACSVSRKYRDMEEVHGIFVI